MELDPAEQRNLRCISGMMVPASNEYDVPGADDPMIFADILASMGRDFADVRAALAAFGGRFADLAPERQAVVADQVRARGGAMMVALSRVILQCYYRDDRIVRSLGLDPRPPFPLGHKLEQGDWSLLDPVRARPPMWRDVTPR